MKIDCFIIIETGKRGGNPRPLLNGDEMFVFASARAAKHIAEDWLCEKRVEGYKVKPAALTVGESK